MAAAIRNALGLAMLLGFAPQESRPHQDAASRKAVAKFTVRGTALDQHGNPYRGHLFLTPLETRVATTTGGRYLTIEDRATSAAIALTNEKGQFQCSEVQPGHYLLGPCVGFDEELDVARFGYPIAVVDRDTSVDLPIHRGHYAQVRLRSDGLVQIENPLLDLWSPETGLVHFEQKSASSSIGPLVPAKYEVKIINRAWSRSHAGGQVAHVTVPGAPLDVELPAPARVSGRVTNLAGPSRYVSVYWMPQNEARLDLAGVIRSGCGEDGTIRSLYFEPGSYIAVAVDDRGNAAVSDRFHITAGSGIAGIHLPLAPAARIRCTMASPFVEADIRVLRGDKVLMRHRLRAEDYEVTLLISPGPIRLDGTVWIPRGGPGCELLPIRPQEFQLAEGGAQWAALAPKGK